MNNKLVRWKYVFSVDTLKIKKKMTNNVYDFFIQQHFGLNLRRYTHIFHSMSKMSDLSFFISKFSAYLLKYRKDFGIENILFFLYCCLSVSLKIQCTKHLHICKITKDCDNKTLSCANKNNLMHWIIKIFMSFIIKLEDTPHNDVFAFF